MVIQVFDHSRNIAYACQDIKYVHFNIVCHEVPLMVIQVFDHSRNIAYAWT